MLCFVSLSVLDQAVYKLRQMTCIQQLAISVSFPELHALQLRLAYQQAEDRQMHGLGQDRLPTYVAYF